MEQDFKALEESGQQDDEHDNEGTSEDIQILKRRRELCSMGVYMLCPGDRPQGPNLRRP
jgi:hypothetical protein